MTDDRLSHFKPLDPGRILVDDELKLQYRCKHRRCARSALPEAASRVGDRATAMRDDLASLQ